ncbi:MAG: hypothetical protein IT563_09735 [Alphaproteobacteria bacterium]|nr:hypothetical protein [Alphaproteobacteria bacterium]
MPGVYRSRAAARRIARPLNPTLLGGGGTRVAAVNAGLATLANAAAAKCLLKAGASRTLAAATSVAAVSTSGTRSASVARTLAGLGRAIRADTGVWTVWQPIEVIVCPGSIWDFGASMWDGADDVYDNDGAIWDPTSPFGAQSLPAPAAWTLSGSAAATWVEPLR